MKPLTQIKIALFVCAVILAQCTTENKSKEEIITQIDTTLNHWHKTAANADTTFFDFLTEDAIYIGTDATERWTKQEFEDYAMPYFRKGRAWSFTPKKRNIYLNEKCNFAYFDEVLDTWMGICRASGVVYFINNEWKLKHYQLAMTIPNEKVQEVLKVINTMNNQDDSK